MEIDNKIVSKCCTVRTKKDFLKIWNKKAKEKDGS